MSHEVSAIDEAAQAVWDDIEAALKKALPHDQVRLSHDNQRLQVNNSTFDIVDHHDTYGARTVLLAEGGQEVKLRFIFKKGRWVLDQGLAGLKTALLYVRASFLSRVWAKYSLNAK